MNVIIEWFRQFIHHLEHQHDPVNVPAPATPLPPSPPGAGAAVDAAHVILPTGDAHGLTPPPVEAGTLNFLQRIMASGNAQGANAGGSGNTNASASTPLQPDFRDGNVHRFEGPGSWDLVADRKCGVRFSGGESGGVPGPVTIAVSVNGIVVLSFEGASTFYDIPDASGSTFPLEAGDRVSISITGRPNLGMNATLRVMEPKPVAE